MNRGYKYIMNDKNNTKHMKLVYISFSNSKTKSYKLFEMGYKNNSLCYIKNIYSIIHIFFN